MADKNDIAINTSDAEMTPPKQSGQNVPLSFKQRLRTRKCLAIIVTILLFVALAVALLGWGIHKAVTRNESPAFYPLAVILPLYVYPEPGAWDPLYNVLVSFPCFEIQCF
jgi:hypothetical protein